MEKRKRKVLEVKELTRTVDQVVIRKKNEKKRTEKIREEFAQVQAAPEKEMITYAEQ